MRRVAASGIVRPMRSMTLAVLVLLIGCPSSERKSSPEPDTEAPADVPADDPDTEEQDAEEQDAEDPDTGEQDAEAQDTEQQDTEEQDTEEQEAEPDVEPDADDPADAPADVADPPDTPEITGICGVPEFDDMLVAVEAEASATLLLAQQPDLSWAPSKIYHWADLVEALHTACVGIGGFAFFTGDDKTVAAVNLAAFLAQSMKETIRYDACDENNWDNANGYPIAGACGQLDQDYAEYDCDMACPKDPTLQMHAVTNATWWGAPGPMFCAPDSALIEAGKSTDGATGYWDYNSDCWPYPANEPDFEVDESLPPWLRPECEVYKGQKGGKYVFDGSSGSVEGCCWWGRGVIQTTGRCNFGRLNHFLGQTHLDPAAFPPPASVPYPELNFCTDPEVICASPDHPELKWIAGLFYWANSVQAYDVDGWAYPDQLQAYVQGGLQGHAFIDAVSGIVNRGCHNPPCATGPVDGLEERRANFEKALVAMGLKAP